MDHRFFSHDDVLCEVDSEGRIAGQGKVRRRRLVRHHDDLRAQLFGQNLEDDILFQLDQEIKRDQGTERDQGTVLGIVTLR